MVRARAAYKKGDYQLATELAQQVKAMNVSSPFWDDTPDKLLADIERKMGGKPIAAVQANGENPRLLVKRAREALDNNRLDVALDLARQAEANGRTTEWGLFDDTPDSIMKKVQEARGRRDRNDADRLVAQARGLFEKQSGTAEQRAVNLDAARGFCLQAIQLHGPYNVWNYGDRADSLLKEIDNARSKLKVAPRKPDASELATAKKTRDSKDVATATPRPLRATTPRPKFDLSADSRLASDKKEPDFYMPDPDWDKPKPKKQVALDPSSEPGINRLPPQTVEFGGGTVVSKGPNRIPATEVRPERILPVGETAANVPLPEEVVNPADEPKNVRPATAKSPYNLTNVAGSGSKTPAPTEPNVPYNSVRTIQPESEPDPMLPAVPNNPRDALTNKAMPKVPYNVVKFPIVEEVPNPVLPVAPNVQSPLTSGPTPRIPYNVVKTQIIEVAPNPELPLAPADPYQPPIRKTGQVPYNVVKTQQTEEVPDPVLPAAPVQSNAGINQSSPRVPYNVVKTEIIQETPNPELPHVNEPGADPLRQTAPRVPYNVVKATLPEGTQGDLLPSEVRVVKNEGTAVKPVAQDGLQKAQAVRLMQQASAYQKGGRFIEARDALADAQRRNVVFDVDEETPEMMLQSLAAAAQSQINALCNKAHTTMVKKTADDVATAEQMLMEAETLAGGFGLSCWLVDNHRDMLRSIKGQSSTVASAKPEVSEPVLMPPESLQIDPRTNEPMVTAKPVDQGLQMLKQAQNEIRANQLGNARKIAMQVLNSYPAHKGEAEAMLRTLEAEETKQQEKVAVRAYERGVEALHSRNYEQALNIFKLIEKERLPIVKRERLTDDMALAASHLEKSDALTQVGEQTHVVHLPSAEKSGADSLLKQQEAMMELQFQKLRAEGLQLEANATARFGKGDTDTALQELDGFIVRVKTASLDPAKVTLLTQPIQNRIERLKVLKHQQDFLTKESKDLKSFRNQMSHEALHTEHKHEEVAQLMKTFAKLMDEGKFQEAGKTAMTAHQLDPEDPVTTAAMTLAKRGYRLDKWKTTRKDSEDYAWEIGNDAFDYGPPVNTNDPVNFSKKRFEEIKNRSAMGGGISSQRPRTIEERRLESELNTRKVNFSFKDQPIDEVITFMQTYTGLNFDLDTKSLQKAGIDPRTPITASYTNHTLKYALELVLAKANLSYIIDKELIRVTTQEGLRGRMQQRVIPVADLVIPVQNYAPAPITDLNTQLQHTMNQSRPMLGGNTTPFTPPVGLGNGMGSPTGTASLTGPGARPGSSGTLQSGMSSAGPVTTVTKGGSATIEEALIHLITSSVHPNTWEAMGGAGRIEYYPLGMALVINQTPDVIEEVTRLLESLRQLQDLEVAIEVRMITLAETFYERIGLDFSMNVSTHNQNASSRISGSSGFEQQSHQLAKRERQDGWLAGAWRSDA